MSILQPNISLKMELEEDNLLSLLQIPTHTYTNFYLHARCTTTHHKAMPDSHHSAGGPWPHTTQKVHIEPAHQEDNRQTSTWLLTQDLGQIHSGGDS